MEEDSGASKESDLETLHGLKVTDPLAGYSGSKSPTEEAEEVTGERIYAADNDKRPAASPLPENATLDVEIANFLVREKNWGALQQCLSHLSGGGILELELSIIEMLRNNDYESAYTLFLNEMDPLIQESSTIDKGLVTHCKYLKSQIMPSPTTLNQEAGNPIGTIGSNLNRAITSLGSPCIEKPVNPRASIFDQGVATGLISEKKMGGTGVTY